MSHTKIGDVVSRIRNQVKSVKQDAFLTDRFIFSLVSKHAKWLMKREDAQNKIMRFSSVIDTLDFVELIEIDKVEAGCTGIKSDITIRRTKDPLPVFMQGYWGPLIRAVTSLDSSESMQPTNPTTYLSITNSKNFKYNKTHYFWYMNDHLYFPDIDWDAVRVEGVFEDDISLYKCDPSQDCLIRQEQKYNMPDYLLGEMEAQVIKDLAMMLQIPGDPSHDKQNIAR
jgi:hypothetical protein